MSYKLNHQFIHENPHSYNQYFSEVLFLKLLFIKIKSLSKGVITTITMEETIKKLAVKPTSVFKTNSTFSTFKTNK